MWVYRDKEVYEHSDLLEGCTDFVYMITYVNGQHYIGKKCVMAKRKKPPLKGKVRCRRLMTKLPFVKYEGSHSLSGMLSIEYKEILYQCKSKKAATYLETALLYHHDAIFDPNFINENISGMHFSNSLDGLLE